MKSFDEMYGDELTEFYELMCDEIIAATKRLKLSIVEKRFSAEETFYDHLACKMNTLKRLQDETRKRIEALFSDGEEDEDE